MFEMITNKEGEEVGMYVTRTYPVYEGTDRDGNPLYRFVLVQAPLIFRFPEIIFNVSDN